MMISAKPMSSPSRGEKYPIPPPLMRFLRSNVGSRSRGRSRSSPMFVRKKNTVIETQQEPTSPKVSCIGQVQVRRSSAPNSGRRHNRRSKSPSRNYYCSCSWINKALFCQHFSVKLAKPKSILPNWNKWVLFFRCGYCGKSEIGDDSSKSEPNLKNKNRAKNRELENEADDEEEEERVQIKVVESEDVKSSSPPKNALLLTRCRSAPYRSSSLASRFWGSTETEDGNEVKEVEDREETERPTSENEPNCRDSSLESGNNDQESSEVEEGVTINGKTKDVRVFQEVEIRALPLTLMRCKSEPAARQRRLGFSEPSLLNGL